MSDMASPLFSDEPLPDLEPRVQASTPPTPLHLPLHLTPCAVNQLQQKKPSRMSKKIFP
jgi:hypothetical protein